MVRVKLAVGVQFERETLPRVESRIVQPLPKHASGRGLPGVGDLEVHRRRVLGPPALGRALQAWLAGTEPDAPLALEGEAPIGGVAQDPVLPVAREPPGRSRPGGLSVEPAADVKVNSPRVWSSNASD